MIINQETNGIINLNPLELDSFEGTVVDLREQAEIDAMPLDKDVIKIKNSEVFNEKNKINFDKPVLMICQKGPRSYEAAVKLKQNGVKNVFYLGGGLAFYNQMNVDIGDKIEVALKN
jgi:rhodanese-related sulfurtransferase